MWTTRDGGGRWTHARLLPTRQGFPIPQLACRGSDVWVVFHEGAAAGTEGYRVLRSLDGGSTWRAVLATPMQSRLPSISNYSGPIAVIGGGEAVLEGSCSPCDGYGTVTIVHGSVRKTLRGVSPGPIAFADRRRGLAVLTPSPRGLPAIYRTLDGGKTWKRVFSSKRLKP